MKKGILRRKHIDYKALYEDVLLKYRKKKERFKKIMELNDRHSKELKELNAKLRVASITDPMTGAYNRRYFYDSATQMIALARREGFNISLAIMDIDDFKNINDTYGHHIGDIVIKNLVSMVKEHIRASDLFARFGGEEFVLLLNNIKEENGMNFFNRLREIIKDSSPKDDIRYTVSIGMTNILKKDKDIDEALKRADKALYKAKRSGKNQVIKY